MFRRITWRDFRGILIAASKPSPMFSPEPSTHGDSMGNSGVIASGEVQWMTAGSGIIHQEMPKGDPAGRMHGFQLWGNLPSSLKMTAPRYQEVKAPEIPEITDDDGTHVRVVCGSFWGKTGPVDRRGCRSDLSGRVHWSARQAQRRFPSRQRAMLSPTFLQAAGSSATRPVRSRCRPKRSVAGHHASRGSGQPFAGAV